MPKVVPVAAADAWARGIARSRTVELSIGGQRIDKHYQKWWRLYAELYMDESAKLNYGKMTSRCPRQRKGLLAIDLLL